MMAKLGTLHRVSFILTGARIAGAGIGIVLQIIIARFYGPETLGTYYLALSLASVLSVFISVGYPWIIAPVIARSQTQKNDGELTQFLHFARRDIVASSLLLGIPTAVLIWVIPGLTLEYRTALSIGLATAPIYSVMRISGSIANALKYFQLANLPELFFRPALTLILVLGALLLTIQLDSKLIISINFLVTLTLTIWMSALLPKDFRFDFSEKRTISTVSKVNLVKHAAIRRLAIPMIFSTLFINMFSDLDLFFIGLIMPAKEAGVFGVCLKVAALLVFAIQIVHQILLRDASDAHMAKDKDIMREVLRNANKFAVLASLGSLVLVALFGNMILGLFGSEFRTGYYALIGLVLAQTIRAIAGPAMQILMITENQRAGTRVFAASIIMLLLANLVLVPIFDYEGAAAAVIVTTLFWTIWLNQLVKRKTGYPVSVFATI